MALSTGSRHVLLTAGSWALMGAMGVGSLLYYGDLKTTTAWLLGLPPPGTAVVEAASPDAEPAARAAEGRSASPRQSSGGRVVELRSGSNGHFSARAEVNGRSIDVLVDTGATFVALTAEDAERAGIFVRPSEFTGRSSTANGTARFAPVTLDSVRIGDITVRNVRAGVMEHGLLGTTLLGMSFLGKLSRAEMRQGALVLEE